MIWRPNYIPRPCGSRQATEAASAPPTPLAEAVQKLRYEAKEFQTSSKSEH
jgi:hypothetical protein